MIAIRGAGSTIAQELIGMLPITDTWVVDRDDPMPAKFERYLFCQGVLFGEKIGDLVLPARYVTNDVNFADIAAECDTLIETNDEARICIIGSESGFRGSFDMAYAGAKAAMHLYVETKQLRTPAQQLVCVSPTIIMDSGMTERRTDRARVHERALQHPKKRFLRAIEVARMVHFLLYVDKGYTTGTVIRMHGGER